MYECDGGFYEDSYTQPYESCHTDVVVHHDYYPSHHIGPHIDIIAPPVVFPMGPHVDIITPAPVVYPSYPTYQTQVVPQPGVSVVHPPGGAVVYQRQPDVCCCTIL